ncbi:MFS transporter [Fusibacter ferrireducens]|uniref:MFS transporter n=1 Tax=Fusibacter ferrireducens TaxID=2785058 RepID=A0ABR9ZW75_9FIRM|nr:MFS transporter [Fusibacter ferrireducens]MBF4694723.1 MFS transporter [Fusibacter ferrireducens]
MGFENENIAQVRVEKVKLQSENTNLKFGKAGWGIILYCMAMFFFLIGFSIDGLNIVAPAFAAAHNLEYSSVLGMATYAGFAGLFGYYILGRINVSLGPRITSGICLIGSGLSYIFYGRAQTLFQYAVGLVLVVSFINGASYIAGGSLVAQWFPKKKGLVNGLTTMGHNMGSAFYVPLIALLIGKFGLENGTTITAVVAMILGVIGLLMIRDTPAERGQYPDNVSKEVYETEYFTENVDEKTIWTVPKLLKTKETWMVALVIGINQLVTTGVMSQMVIRNIGLGFTQSKAIGLMTVCAVIGVGGSYMYGWLDQKFGVKKAIIIFLLWYSAALGLNITENITLVYVSVLMVGISIGGAANFIISLPASVFGRHGFAKANSVVFPIMSAILFSNYVINAQAIKITGSLRGAYVVFLCFLLINIFFVSLIDVRKYNKDYKVEDEVI